MKLVGLHENLTSECPISLDVTSTAIWVTYKLLIVTYALALAIQSYV